MSNFLFLIKLFLFNSKLELIKAMQYRFDFFVGTFITLFYTGIGPLAQLIIFTKTRGYPGWTFKQILLFQGMVFFTFGISNLLFRNVQLKIDRLIRNGDFDRLLLIPYPTIGFLLSNGFYINAISSIITGIIVIIYSLSKLHLTLHFWQYCFLTLSIICGLIFSATINIFYCSLSISMINTQKISDIIDKIILFKNFPLQIYPIAIQIIFSFFVPLAIFVYVPSQIILNRLNFTIFMTLISCFILFYLSILCWKRCLKNYSSAGG